MSVNNLATQPTYAQSEWMGQTAWFATAYFVDPTVICAGGRSEADWEAQGTGDRLLVQNGATDNLISIPLTQAEADMDASWYNHFCFLGMGEHYLQFDYTPSQACDSVLPFQILYDEGVITGFVWQHIATLPGDRWVLCLFIFMSIFIGGNTKKVVLTQKPRNIHPHLIFASIM